MIMDSPGRTRSNVKRSVDEGSDGKSAKARDVEEYEGHEKRKYKSSKSRKSSHGEESDGWDGDGRRKSSGDRNDNRKRAGGSSREYSDEDDYDVRKESHSDKAKKKQEESTLEKLSNWYGDRELESRHDGGDKSGGRGHTRPDENEKNVARKTASKYTDAEGSQGRSKSKDEKSYDVDHERAVAKDPKSSERRGSSREKLHGSSEQGRKRSDDHDTVRNHDGSAYADKSDSRSGKGLDLKHEATRERSSLKIESGDGKTRALDSSVEKAKSYTREERKADGERTKSRSRYDDPEEDKGVSSVREDVPDRERGDKYRDGRATGNDPLESRGRSLNLDEDGTGTKDKSGRETGHSGRSRTPERSGRHRHESHISDVEHDRSSSLKRKELDKDTHKDDREKVRDDSWDDRNRDREGSRENWKRRQPSSNDRDADVLYDRDREWEPPRRGRDRMETERPSGRSGGRKDGRGEVVKASSKFGISTENYDVIEIQRKPLDYGREDRESSFPRKNDVAQSEFKSMPNDARDDSHRTGAQGSASAGDVSKEKLMDEGAWKDDADSQGGRFRDPKVATSGRLSSAQSSSSASLPPFGNQDPGSQGRSGQQGLKGARLGRPSRIRPSGRDNQQSNIPVHMMGPPFGPINLPPPGPMQLNPAMSPAPVPPIPGGVFIPPFSPPVWPGARGLDMSILPTSSGVSPLTPGPPGQRFGANMGTPPNPMMFYNQPGPGRGMLSTGSGFNAMVPVGHGQSHDKVSGGWVPPKGTGPPGKAPSRGEQNDYSQNFVDTGMRPQNFIRELELTNVEDYPKLRELIQKKDEIVANVASPPMYYKCDLRDFVLSPDYFGTKFDVILVDPPWEEYVHRAPGVTDQMDSWTFEEIMNLKIEAIADTPSFIFLWVGDGMGLEQGRQCLKKWGFRRCEDICWVKTNKHTATPALRHDSHTLFQHTKEHCLMGIKGTVRRSTDGHIIHANIDTDVIIAEEPPYGSTAKPDEIYRIIEHFALGRRRIELFGEDHNIRSGWLTLGKGLSSSNFNSEAYTRNFADKDGKVWQGGGGRNPPPDAPHLVQTTPEIESLRPKSPMKNQQQLQQQSSSISVVAGSSNRKPSPQTPNPFVVNQEGPSDHLPPWASMEGMRGRDNMFDAYGYNMPPVMPNGEFLDFDPQRPMNMM